MAIIISAYVGARPGGQPPPNLSTVPVPRSGDPNHFFRFLLAFANADSNGTFTPLWDNSITPDIIAKLTQNNSNISFGASLGGANAPWTAPSDQAAEAWITNATNSIIDIIDTYHLTNLDIDYENGANDPSFAPILGQVLNNVWDHFLVRTPEGGFSDPLNLSYAPFNQTETAYRSLYSIQSTNVIINYQAYADFNSPSVNDYLNLYTNTLAPAYSPDRTLFVLGLGVASSTSAPRGLQPPDIFTVWNDLKSQGLGGAMVFSLEDSAKNGYPIERTLLSG